MTHYIVYGSDSTHAHTSAHTHNATHAHIPTPDLPIPLRPPLSCTGAWAGQSSLFKGGCFEFQRGAHERTAEYKGVPKDTL